MKKYLALFFVLASCKEGKISCGVFEVPIMIAADKISTSLECNRTEVEASLKKAFVSIKLCEENVSYSALNGGKITCQFIPLIVRAVGDAATSRWQCKKAGSSLETLLAKVLDCDS